MDTPCARLSRVSPKVLEWGECHPSPATHLALISPSTTELASLPPQTPHTPLASPPPSSPADVDPSSPADGDPSSPADGDLSSPADGDLSSPADGDLSSPADGDLSSPADGDPFSPADGEPSSFALKGIQGASSPPPPALEATEPSPPKRGRAARIMQRIKAAIKSFFFRNGI